MGFYKRYEYPFTNITGTSATLVSGIGYIANNAGLVTLTLPSSVSIADPPIFVIGSGAGGWQIAQNASQQIVWAAGGSNGVNQTTTGTGGHLDSTDRYDCVELLCIAANTWTVISSKGSISLT